MAFESVQKAVEHLNANVNDADIGNPLFNDKRSTPVPFDGRNFRTFSAKDSGKKIAYVDGGNAEILSAPNFSVQMTRIYYIVFQANKRLNPKSIPNKTEFFTICYADAEDGQIKYKTSLIPITPLAVDLLPDEEDMKFDSFDRTLMSGSQRASVSSACSSSRRFAEWKIAAKIIEKELAKGDLIVRDGSLQTSITNESKYADMAYQAAAKKGVIFTGLAKTSELFTTTGYPLLAAVKKMALQNSLDAGSWAYYPIVLSTQPDHKAEMFVVKLNPGAGHIFRFEIFNEQANKMSEAEKIDVISAIARNSSDISFPGYPYGLLLADVNARVRSEEMNCVKLLFMSEVSKPDSRDKFFSCINASDAHDILNRF